MYVYKGSSLLIKATTSDGNEFLFKGKGSFFFFFFRYLHNIFSIFIKDRINSQKLFLVHIFKVNSNFM